MLDYTGVKKVPKNLNQSLFPVSNTPIPSSIFHTFLSVYGELRGRMIVGSAYKKEIC